MTNLIKFTRYINAIPDIRKDSVFFHPLANAITNDVNKIMTLTALQPSIMRYTCCSSIYIITDGCAGEFKV
jgi:hypothetical protein